MMLAFDTSVQVLEIPERIQQDAWQQSQSITPLGQRWQAYLNQVCLQTVLDWLQEKSGSEFLSRTTFWEMVNGSAVQLGEKDIILIPVESSDRTEFRVPQEWVDIPDWIGDYYFAIEFDADEQLLYVWGYTTHQMLKTQGRYDTDDRSYVLADTDLIQDITVFWVMQQLAPEPTRVAVPPLVQLSEAQVENLTQRLANSVIPRLEVPFDRCGALLQQRSLERQSRTPSVNLSQWLNHAFETGWQSIETFLRSEPSFSFRGDEASDSTIRRVKRLKLGATDALLVVNLDVEADDRRRIWVQLLPQAPESVLPESVSLTLISDTAEVLQSVQSGSESNYLQLRRFRCAIATQFQLEVTVSGVRVVETFVS
ncbi:DUF1822 family protein [Leptolyngbya sp. NIES-2104]|uniref:DUF1822 family protein n=1 Tax=Leptolyngbya sp. NIES-2104 TaxID=1552121 RepID=UPI0006EC7B67|nr:DUF1822 family protein [Leptolyngbya sp. NIES-2104]GAP94107.1 hypothetical protein NIES2104_06170 [Leptolyngbya sp. NIES-2104]